MKAAPLISLGLSAVLGAGALLLGRGYLGHSDAEAAIVVAEPVDEIPEVRTVDVWISQREIAAGEILDLDLFEREAWPEDIVPVSMRIDDDVFERTHYARSLIVVGEPLVIEKMDETGAARILSASIEPGMRATSIIVQSDSGVAGFVLPGDFVDVNAFVPFSDERLSGKIERTSKRVTNEMFAKPVVKNVKVLAVDQTLDTSLEGAVVSKTITLEVTPDQAVTLGAAARSGSLSLALIGRSEEIEEQPKRKTAIRRAATPRKSSQPKTATIRVINGADETKVTTPVSTVKHAGDAS